MKPKQTQTGQNEDQQGKEQIETKRNKGTTQVKTKKWRNSGWNFFITVVSHQKLLVSVQPKL